MKGEELDVIFVHNEVGLSEELILWIFRRKFDVAHEAVFLRRNAPEMDLVKLDHARDVLEGPDHLLVLHVSKLVITYRFVVYSIRSCPCGLLNALYEIQCFLKIFKSFCT